MSLGRVARTAGSISAFLVANTLALGFTLVEWEGSADQVAGAWALLGVWAGGALLLGRIAGPWALLAPPVSFAALFAYGTGGHYGSEAWGLDLAVVSLMQVGGVVAGVLLRRGR